MRAARSLPLPSPVAVRAAVRAAAWVAVLLAGTLLGACGGTSAAKEIACDAATYPCGPYGYTAGSTIADLVLPTQHDDNASGSAVDDAVTEVHLSDYRGKAGALALVIGSQICAPCQNEQPTLVDLSRRYTRAAFLEAIVQGQAGAQADQAVVDAWATQFALPFDLTADPSRVLLPYYDPTAFPIGIVVRLSDMQIVHIGSGQITAGDAFETSLAAALP